MKKTVLLLIAGVTLAGGLLISRGAQRSDPLAEGFQRPPDSAKPWVFWWWLNGNVSREGITRDLQEMKRQGINGVLIFQAGGGKTPAGPKFLSPEWRKLFRFALAEAERLGMEVSVNLDDGWDSGGPWITKDEANKKLVSSELQVDGRGRIARTLPMPEVVDGYYHDVAVMAVREKSDQPVRPLVVTASSSLRGYVGEWNFYPQDAADGDPNTYWSARDVAPTEANPQWLQLQYPEELDARAVYVAPAAGNGPRDCELQTTEDGKTFTTVARFRMENGKARTVEFAPVRSKEFRLRVTSAYGAPLRVAEVEVLRKGDAPVLRSGIKWWWFKSGNRSFWDYPRQGPKALEEEYPKDGVSDVPVGGAVDLTRRMDANGRITWDVPEGRWTILRFGYTLEGQRMRAESIGGEEGWEADMLGSEGIDSQFRNVGLPMIEDNAAVGGKALKEFHIDSYELGANVRGQQPTWSPDFREEFRKRRGYDMTPYLPALAGRIVGSRAITDRFLADVRWTIGDLMAYKFWARFAELAHEHGLGVDDETGYGTYPYPHIDGLLCAGMADVPMGEFWFGTDIMTEFNPWGNVIRSVASAAHVYGKPVMAAESFTAWTHWQEWPAAMKPVGDVAFVDGLNRMVFHQYTHQPVLDMKPGWQYNAGTHVDRNITWWEEARAFFQYIARSQFLLQKGHVVADMAYFYGEGVTKFVPSREYVRPELPRGYDFDAVNADVLLHRMSVRNGRFVLPGGASYRVLVLPEDGVMSPEVLRKIREFAAAGAVVVGPKARRAPGLHAYPESDREVAKLAREMWGKAVQDKPLAEALQGIKLAPDFEYRSADSSVLLDFIHHSAPGAEIYFVTNRKDRAAQAECTFRVSARQPELWDPVSGETRPAVAFRQSGGRTTVPLELAPYGSMFVVFRAPIAPGVEGRAVSNFPVYSNPRELTGAWTVHFDPKWGGPASVEFPSLVSWTARPEQGIRYYSGTATYRKTFDLPAELAGAGQRLALDLGDVKYVARVRLNGKDLGVLWTKPFRVEITGAAKATGNVLEVDVVNVWANRIIGDASLPPDKRFGKTNIQFKPDHSLFESGLLGPVKLEAIQRPR